MEAATTIAHAGMPQHMRALAEANRVRLARAALKRSIAGGRITTAEIVRECPWEVETMTIGELLRSQRRWGRTRTRKFLVGLALSENRQLGRLTTRQRTLLAAALEAKRASHYHARPQRGESGDRAGGSGEPPAAPRSLSAA